MGANFDRSLLLSRSNIRKARGQTVAIVVLVFLSSVMMNLWLMLATDYKQNFDRCHDRLNDGHVNMIAGYNGEGFADFIADYLDGSSEVTEYCITDALFTGGTFQFGGGEVPQSFVVQEKEKAFSRNTGKYEITEEGDIKSGIYLPMLYGTGDNYSLGDRFEITMNGEKFEYDICGFFNSAMTGSHNCAMISFLLTEDKYKELSATSAVTKSVYVSVRIKDKMRGESFDTSLKDAVSEKYPGVPLLSNFYEAITTSRYVSQSICAGIMSAMAFFVLLIGVVVISSNVANYIKENMQNLGALKAVGYTGRQLVFSLIMQFSGISTISAAAGVAVSYGFFPGLNEMMIAQTGIPYEVKFLPVPFIITVLFITVIAAGAVYLSAKGIKKIETITALRQGIATHNFKRNHVQLEKTSLPLQLALALKTTLSGLKRNVTVCITMLVISLILVFSGLMFENMIMNIQPFVDLIAGESADSSINVNLDIEEEFLAAINGDSRVEKIYLYHNNAEVQHVGEASLTATVSDDFSMLNNQSIILEGRFPKYDNETAIGAKYAKESGLKVGDEISLKAEGNEQTYIISGFTQISNYLGKDCMLTREGYEKIGSMRSAGYYLNLADGTDIDGFNSEMQERFIGKINSTFNIESVVQGTGSVYVELATVIVTAILILSGIVIIFVMYLLVRTLLNGKKRDYGILKAIGFTTGQLVLQTALSFMPLVIISAAVGIFISAQIINPLFALFLSGVGVVKCTFTVPMGFNVIAGIGLVVFAFGAACLMSLRVRRITARELLVGE